MIKITIETEEKIKIERYKELHKDVKSIYYKNQQDNKILLKEIDEYYEKVEKKIKKGIITAQSLNNRMYYLYNYKINSFFNDFITSLLISLLVGALLTDLGNGIIQSKGSQYVVIVVVIVLSLLIFLGINAGQIIDNYRIKKNFNIIVFEHEEKIIRRILEDNFY